MRPTRSDIERLRLDALPDAAAHMTTLGQQIEGDGARIRATVAALDWSGRARRAAEGRAAHDAAQFTAAAQACDELAAAIAGGHAAMSDLAGRLRASVAGWERDGFVVDNSWTAHDGYNYGLADALAADSPTTRATLARLKQERAAQAAAASADLGRLATQFDEADQDCAAALHRATRTLAGLTPVTAAIGGAVAERIAERLRAGKALSDFERQVLDIATTLTPEQTETLRAGRPAAIAQSQYDFLRELTAALDGIALDDLRALGTGEQHGEIQAHVANSLEILGIPNLSTVAGDHGGMAVLPPTIRTLLTTKLPTGKVTPSGSPERESAEIKRLGDFLDLTALIATSDESTRLGSDVNRAILKQSAEISGAYARTTAAVDTTTSAVIDNAPLDARLSAALSTAASDRFAAHDFLTGTGMDVTCSDGGRYRADEHLAALGSQAWGTQTRGLHTLVDWVGSASDADDPVMARLAHESAGALGRSLGSAEFAATNAYLGIQTPEFARALVGAVHPYLASYTGEGLPGIPTHGVDALTQQQLNQLFTVLSTDESSAVTLHSEAAKWKNAMAYQYGTDTESPAIATHAGQLAQAMSFGSDQANTVLADTQKAAYDSKVLAWNSLKETAGMIPHSAWVSVPMVMSEQAAVGAVPTPESAANAATAPDAVAQNNSPTMLSYFTLLGYVADPENAHIYREWLDRQTLLPPGERSELFGADGVPRWDYARTPRGRDELTNLLATIPGGAHESAPGAWRDAYAGGVESPGTEPVMAQRRDRGPR